MPDPIRSNFLAGARGAARRLLAFAVCGGLLLTAAAGCRPETDGADAHLRVSVEFDPAGPTVGVNRLNIVLSDVAGQPVQLGQLSVEGNMNHAGMKPVFVRLSEGEPGHYAGTIEFTMGGDWFLLLSGELCGTERFEKKVDVRGVRSK